MVKQPQTPYCGFVRDENDYLHVVRSAAHVLVTGPTEIGKSRRILLPAALLWGGPVVFVSSKDTELQLLSARRCFGPSALIDLRPDYDADYFGVDNLAFDPTTLITTPDQAVTAANTMMQMSAVGLGSGADQVSDAGIWEANTEAPLSAMLYAASPMGNNKGMDWVLLAVDNMTKLDPDADPTLWKEPGWSSAAQIVRHLPLFSNALLRTLDMDARQRDSIALTMRKAVMPWMRLALRGKTYRPFDAAFLDDPQATLYVLSPPEGSIAGAAVTLLEHLIKVWRAKTARKEMLHRLLIVIDEAANVAPMPALRRHVSEGRGLGVNLLVAVQATSQLDTVYGNNYARELRDTFPASLIMFGAPESDLLRRAEEWTLLTTRRQESFDQASSQKTLSSHEGSTLEYRRLLPENTEHARLLIRGTAGHQTEIPDWTEFLRRYDLERERRISQQPTPLTDNSTITLGRRDGQHPRDERGPTGTPDGADRGRVPDHRDRVAHQGQHQSARAAGH